jgi:hypothetical protein
MCAFLRYWAGLQDEKDKEMVLEGASRLQRGATAAYEMARQGGVSRARIHEDIDEDICLKCQAEMKKSPGGEKGGK